MMDPDAASHPFGLAYIKTRAGGVGLKVLIIRVVRTQLVACFPLVLETRAQDVSCVSSSQSALGFFLIDVLKHLVLR